MAIIKISELPAAIEPISGNSVLPVVDGSNVTVKATVQQVRQFISVKDYGAVGDDIADDSPKIQAAIDATPSGGTLVFPAGSTYFCASRLTVTSPITISAYGATIRFGTSRTGGENNDAITITSSNVKIMGGTWKEAAPTNNVGPYGIVFAGVENNSSTPPTYIKNVGIQDANVVDWRGESIVFRMCQNFYAVNCSVSNIGYTGISTLSSNQGLISNNRVGDINPNGAVGSGENAYGIAISSNQNANTVGRPMSHDVTVSGNYVYNVKTWEGIDTHGGYNLTISGNTVRNCMTGIAMVKYEDADPAKDAAARNIAITGNSIQNDPAVFPGRTSLQRGIILEGDARTSADIGYASCITGNTLTYCGGKTSSEDLGAIEVQNVHGCVVSGNSIYDAGSVGIMMWSCPNSLVDGNVIHGITPYNSAEFPTATATFSGNPTAADTITFNNVVCTFTATPSAINSNSAIDVLIGATLSDTLNNLKSILDTARDTGTASVMPNGRLGFTSFTKTNTTFVVTYRYPTRMLSTGWGVSKSSSVIAWSGASLSIPSDDYGAGIRIDELGGGASTPSGQVSNNFIRNPTSSGIAIRGISQTCDSQVIFRNNSLSGKGVLYDIKGSSVLTCSDVQNFYQGSIAIDLPSISAGAKYEFFLPFPTASVNDLCVSASGYRYLDGLVCTIQTTNNHAIVQLVNPTSGAINVASDVWKYEVKQSTNLGNYGQLN